MKNIIKFGRKSAILLKTNLIGNQFTMKISKKLNKNLWRKISTKEGSHCICLPVILIDSVFRTGKNYYPQ